MEVVGPRLQERVGKGRGRHFRQDKQGRREEWVQRLRAEGRQRNMGRGSEGRGPKGGLGSEFRLCS